MTRLRQAKTDRLDERVSLYPVDGETAMKALLATPKPAPKARKTGTPAKRARKTR